MKWAGSTVQLIVWFVQEFIICRLFLANTDGYGLAGKIDCKVEFNISTT